MMSISAFTDAYITCALWSSVSEGDDPCYGITDQHNQDDIAPETLASMERDCIAFYEQHEILILRDVARAGHDFWLTRCGHGAGFWDGDWPNPDARVLTAASYAFGEVNLIVGDDGLIRA